MFRKLMPKDTRFFTLFDRQVEAIQRGLDLFGQLLNDYDARTEISTRIKEAEHDADVVVHEIIGLLNNSFITPFDHEDIQALVGRLDDVIDMVEETTARMDIYDLPAPPDDVREMSRILRHAFQIVALGVGNLGHLERREEIRKILVEVNRIENEGDAVLRTALRRLFKDATDPLYVIKMQEIYENLERAIDRCEDVANALETIMVKNA